MGSFSHFFGIPFAFIVSCSSLRGWRRTKSVPTPQVASAPPQSHWHLWGRGVFMSAKGKEIFLLVAVAISGLAFGCSKSGDNGRPVAQARGVGLTDSGIAQGTDAAITSDPTNSAELNKRLQIFFSIGSSNTFTVGNVNSIYGVKMTVSQLSFVNGNLASPGAITITATDDQGQSFRSTLPVQQASSYVDPQTGSNNIQITYADNLGTVVLFGPYNPALSPAFNGTVSFTMLNSNLVPPQGLVIGSFSVMGSALFR
ncbi:MAG: hypothetical protein C5B49_08665 [Bdellovibrio sp.]|nr:MAG: hypothetical protein C5B49_08665 [Bdellovibrio sp.]